MRVGTLCLLVALVASNTAAAHDFDVVSLTPAAGWTVDDKGGYLSLTRTSGNDYCLVAVYASTPAAGDLTASFGAAWTNLVERAVVPAMTPAPSIAPLGNSRAAAGGSPATLNGTPVVTILMVVDAGPRVVSILMLAPSMEAFASFTTDVQAMLGSLQVRRAADPAPAPDGKLVIPPPSRALTLADLVGEWGSEDGINTRYVDRDTGSYVGFDSLHFRTKWIVSAKGAVLQDFFAIRNGKKIIEKTNGTVRISGRIIDMKVGSAAKYVVRGWLELPEVTIMVVCGPFYGEVPQDILDNPNQGANLNENWVRRTKRK